ncbi:MAG: hypothetical protein WAV11_01565 [Minisyncoccia bacterium]
MPNTKKCAITVEKIGFFFQLGQQCEMEKIKQHYFPLTLVGSEKKKKPFLDRKKRREQWFTFTEGNVYFLGKSGQARFCGYINNNHEKPCQVKFSLRTEKGTITALF